VIRELINFMIPSSAFLDALHREDSERESELGMRSEKQVMG